MENVLSAVPPGEIIAHQGQEKIDDFFAERYHSLSRWCQSRYNGSGQDVMHSAYELAIDRYQHINFSLFASLCAEAARNLQIHRWTQDANRTIILPPTDLAAERLSAHLAAAPSDEQPDFPQDCIRAARKLVRAEKKGQLCFWTAGGVR
jgi:hypothetical protein